MDNEKEELTQKEEMPQEAVPQNETAQEETSQEGINPDEIVFDDAESDADMPVQETHDYKDSKDDKTLTLTPMFYKLFYQCLGSLPADTIMVNEQNQQMRLAQLIHFMDAKIVAHQYAITVKEMNTILSFILKFPANNMQQLADLVAHNQAELWTLNN